MHIINKISTQMEKKNLLSKADFLIHEIVSFRLTSITMHLPSENNGNRKHQNADGDRKDTVENLNQSIWQKGRTEEVVRLSRSQLAKSASLLKDSNLQFKVMKQNIQMLRGIALSNPKQI